MLTDELTKIKNHADALLAMFRAGLQHEEQHFEALVHKAEWALHVHLSSPAAAPAAPAEQAQG